MGDIETILVAGATGGTGRETLRVLQSTDHEVVATARSPDDRGELLARGADRVVLADLLDALDAARAVRGCDAVVCAVGSRPGIRPFTGAPLVDGTGVRNLVTAAVAAEVEHFVFESAIGVGDSAPGMPAPFRLLLTPVLRAKREAEGALRTADLPSYTILRPGMLTNQPATEDVLVGEGGATVSGSIPRADVARLLVAALTTPDARNRTFEVVARSDVRGTPRGLVDVPWEWPEGAATSETAVEIDVEEGQTEE